MLSMVRSVGLLCPYVTVVGVALLASCGPGEGCPKDPPLISLVDHDRWQRVTLDEDLFEPAEGDDIYPCDERDTVVEQLGDVTTWSVTTGGCNWVTVSQALPRDLGEGDELFIELFWFSQRDFPGAIANVAIAVGSDVVLTRRVEVPADAELVEATVTLPRHAAAGTPLTFHVGNHGTNSWNLIDVSLKNDEERPAYCPAPE